MALKPRRSEKKRPNAIDTLPEGVRAWITLAEQTRQEARKAYEDFFKRAKDLPPIERAESWLRHVADHPDNDGDLEAVVYLASRGHDCTIYISRILSEWKEAEAERLRQNASAMKIPAILGQDIVSASPLFLRDFWTCDRSQENAIDATMLRTVEWCNIAGFEPWWNRLARTANESVLRWGMDALGGCFWLFNMCRSPYTIRLMPRVLDRCLDTVDLCDSYQRFPWVQTAERGEIPERRLAHIEHIYYAAAVAFCHSILRPVELNGKELAIAASHIIQKHQMASGGWGVWADSLEPSIEMTAAAIHALAFVRPPGYVRNLKGATEWLLAQQDPGGYWREAGCPDPTYLTVLVLDALALARGEDKLTFRRSEETVQSSGGVSQFSAAKYRFNVALSFPGEHRARVERIAQILAAKIGSERVLYDEWHRAEFARPNLDVYLPKLYHEESLLLVFFLCGQYAKKEWCGLEWRAGRDLLKKNQDDRLMFLRLDDADIPGLYSGDGYLDIDGMPPEEVAREILSRIAMVDSNAASQLTVDAGSLALGGQSVADAQGWEGVEFQGTFYAWAGPLLAVEDRASVPYLLQLLDALKECGLRAAFGNPEKLSEHLGRGSRQVFATDRKSWRRPVVNGRQFLLVRRPNEEEE
jgi:hypothetical protein